MKKKLLAMLLALSMTLAVAACSDGGDDGTTKDGPVTAAEARELIEESLHKVRTVEKAAVTLEMIQEEFSSETATEPEGSTLMKIEYLFGENGKFLVNGYDSAYDAATDAEIPEYKKDSSAYITPADAGKFDFYQLYYDQTGALKTANSYKDTVSGAFADVMAKCFLAGGESSYMTAIVSALLTEAEVTEAKREGGVVTMTGQVVNAFLLENVATQDCEASFTGTVQPSYEAKYGVELSYNRTYNNKTTWHRLHCTLSVAHDAAIPDVDVTGVTQSYIVDEGEFVAEMLGEIAESMNFVESTDGTAVTTYDEAVGKSAAREEWSILTTDKAVVYGYYTYDREPIYKTFYDFKDAAAQDVYYEESLDLTDLPEEIGTIVDSGMWYDHIDAATLTYNAAENEVKLTKDGSVVVFKVGFMGLLDSVSVTVGDKTYTDKYAYSDTPAPKSDDFAGFTLKTRAA